MIVTIFKWTFNFNIWEWNMVITNIPFFFAGIIFCLLLIGFLYLYKKLPWNAISLFLLSIFSPIYHICYLSIHVTFDTLFSFYKFCPINDISIYGLSLMFIDMFFANSSFMFNFVLVLPIVGKMKNTMSARYTIAFLSLFIIFFSGIFIYNF